MTEDLVQLYTEIALLKETIKTQKEDLKEFIFQITKQNQQLQDYKIEELRKEMNLHLDFLKPA